MNPNKLVPIEKKMAAHLAADKNLKESAQRAFNAYIKSVFLMRDKKIFDAHAIDVDKFAESLGLAVAPRVRFLAKQKKIQAAQKQKVSTNNQDQTKKEDESSDEEEETEIPPVKTTNEKIKFDSDSEDESDVFTVKRTNVQLENEDDNDEGINVDINEDLRIKNRGVMSKVQAAKKMLKKNIVPNMKKTFDESGSVLADSSKSKMSAEGRAYEDEAEEERDGGGINLDRVKAVMKAEDRIDRETERRRHKEARQEKKRKEKEDRKRKRGADDEEEEGDSDSEESVDLSWLPDPDKVSPRCNDFADYLY